MDLRSIFISLIFLPMSAMSVSAANYGILGLYKNVDNQNQKFNKSNLKQILVSRNCRIARTGLVVAEDGDIDLPAPDRFMFIACDAAPPDDLTDISLLNVLKSNTTNLTLFEGPFKVPYAQVPTLEDANRSYILKVSNYNNKNPHQRQQDLAKLDKKVTNLPDKYVTEAHIKVTSAYGSKTPDEAVILYYNTAQHGEKFRKGNPKILKQIGAFNDNHLVDYIYYIGQLKD